MFRNIVLYLREMFPLPHVMATLMMSISFYCGLGEINAYSLTFDLRLVYGAVSVVFFALLLRVMDEFKDYQDDLINYPERPLPSGRIRRVDLKVLLGLTVFVLAILNSQNEAMAFAGLLVFAYSILMFKWFFAEKYIRPSLFLALLTHNPVVYIYYLYMFVVYCQVDTLASNLSALLMIPLGLATTNWEISRKIRIPKNESSYVTYSQIWGFRGAITVSLCLQTVSALLIGIFFYWVGTPWFLVACYYLMWMFNVSFYMRLMQLGNSASDRWHKLIPLRKFAEAQGALIQLTLIASYLIRN